jgi:hypothetical protein
VQRRIGLLQRCVHAESLCERELRAVKKFVTRAASLHTKEK